MSQSPEYLPFARPTLDEDTIQGVVEVLRSGWITTGPLVLQLEEALSHYLLGCPVRCFTSATAALEVALQACGIGPGDEVIVPAMSFVASANVVLRVGARPVLVDVDLHTRNIDVTRIEHAITARTKAIMPVHFAGLAADCEAIYALAERHRLRVVEDAAHAIGSRYRGRPIGSFGDIVCFSFHPNKTITTIEGGALACRDESILRAAGLQRFHGIERDIQGNVEVLVAGGKSNLTDVAARVGLGQIRHLEAFTGRRRALAELYFAHLRTDPPLMLPARDDGDHGWHLFAPLLPLAQMSMTRQDFIGAMHARGIGVGVHYPAIAGFNLYRGLGYQLEDTPNAARIGRETVTLPLFPAMADADVRRVCETAAQVLGSGKAR